MPTLVTVVCVALTLGLGLTASQRLDSPHKYLTLVSDTSTCSERNQCGFSFCLWKRHIRLGDDSCVFIENTCKCPRDFICTLTDHITPGSSIITLNAYCLRPRIEPLTARDYRNHVTGEYGSSSRGSSKRKRVYDLPMRAGNQFLM